MNDSFFKAIADRSRRKILFLLRGKSSLTAGEIASQFEMTKASLSDHLKILRNAGLVSADKRGQFIHYSLNTSVFEDIVSWLTDILDKNEVKNDETEEL